MIADIQTPGMDLPAAPQPTDRPQLLRLPPIRWPSASNVAKAGASVAILVATTSLVLMRAPEISRAQAPDISLASVTPSPAIEPVPATTAAPMSANSECSNQVWPYIAAGCLQGQTQPDAARMAVATSQPETSSEASKSEPLSRAEPAQSPRRETREERRARRYEERRARYGEQRAQYEAQYEERRARYDERRARRYQFAF